MLTHHRRAALACPTWLNARLNARQLLHKLKQPVILHVINAAQGSRAIWLSHTHLLY